MGVIDLETMLKGLSPESPCGVDLEYDPDFLAMARAAQPPPASVVGDESARAEEPDWKEVRALATGLLERTRDVRVASYLARALLAIDGIRGFAEGVVLTSELLHRHWKDVHPALDPSDGNDPTARINCLLALAAPESTLIRLGGAPLMTWPGSGRFSLREVLAARGKPGAREGAPPPDMAPIQAGFDGIPVAEIVATLEAVTGALESLSSLEAFLLETIGPNQAPDLEELTRLLRSGQSVLSEQAARRSAEPGVAAPSSAAAGTPPSSPIPLLLRRAKRLGAKSFLEIVRDLAPDGTRQAESIRGASGED